MDNSKRWWSPSEGGAGERGGGRWAVLVRERRWWPMGGAGEGEEAAMRLSRRERARWTYFGGKIHHQLNTYFPSLSFFLPRKSHKNSSAEEKERMREMEAPGIRRFNCMCGILAPIRTSWIDDNPGRRFHGCVNRSRNGGGCGFFEWEDPPMCTRARAVIPGLLRRINNLEGQVAELQERDLSLRHVQDEIAEQRKKIFFYLLLLPVSWLPTLLRFLFS